MWQDFFQASLHHLLVLGLIAMLVTQSVLLSRPLDAVALRRLAAVDIGVGLSAGLLLLVGLWRVFDGLKGADFYLHNPWFHAKLGAFLLAAALSLWPTLRLIRWRRQMKLVPEFKPAPVDSARLCRFVRLELGLVAVILVFAAGMARHGGLQLPGA